MLGIEKVVMIGKPVGSVDMPTGMCDMYNFLQHFFLFENNKSMVSMFLNGIWTSPGRSRCELGVYLNSQLAGGE